MTKASFFFAKSFNALATETGSPKEPSGFLPTKAIAVGPDNKSSISKSRFSIAKRTKVFL